MVLREWALIGGMLGNNVPTYFSSSLLLSFCQGARREAGELNIVPPPLRAVSDAAGSGLPHQWPDVQPISL